MSWLSYWPFRGHVDLSLQLHGFVSGALFFINFLSCELIMLEIFSVQKQLTFTVFLLNRLCSLLDPGKWSSNKFKKIFETFVMTFGGLNQKMFWLLLCFGLFWLVGVKINLMEWYPLFTKAFSCSTFLELKISILD